MFNSSSGLTSLLFSTFLSYWILYLRFLKPPKRPSLIQHTLVVCWINAPLGHQARPRLTNLDGECPHPSLVFGFLVLILSPCFLPVLCHLPINSLYDAAMNPKVAPLSIAFETLVRARENKQEDTQQGENWNPLGALPLHKRRIGSPWR